jgi:protoheme IX farnesyltransferase
VDDVVVHHLGAIATVTTEAIARPAPIVDLIALVKPRIMVMALLTAAGGLSLAPGQPELRITALLLVGVGLIVGSANALNMYLERDIDCLMARTKMRPLPQGRLRPVTALAFGGALGALSLPVLAVVNPLTVALGVIALISYVALYTPLKQRTHWATWIGAVPGAMPVLMGWTAATGTIDIRALAVFAILFFWQIPHFHAIALYRQRDYDRAGLKTLPGSHGAGAARVHIAVFLVVQVAASLALPALGITGVAYTGVAIALGVAVLVQGLRPRRELAGWARGVFLASIVYLPVLFVAMVLDGRL